MHDDGRGQTGQDPFLNDDGCTYSADRTVLLACTSDLESYIVIDGCAEIAPCAFKCHERLRSIELPASIRVIGDFAFALSGLESFTAPQALRYIGTKAFYRCCKLAYCALDDCLEHIGDEAFSQTALVAFRVPAQVRELGRGVLRGSQVARSFKPQAISSAPGNARFSIDACGALYERTDDGLIMRELMAQNVREHSVMEGTVEVASSAYRNHAAIERVSLPEGVTQIGNGAFRKCTALQQVHLPETLESIGADAFHAAHLREVHLPARLVDVGPCAFMALEEPNSLRSTLERVTVSLHNPRFYTKDDLLIERLERGRRLICHFGKDEEVHVPPEVTEIGPYAFLGCEDAKVLELHDGIERIHGCAFVLDRSIRKVRVQLTCPVCGREYIEVCFPQQAARFILFSRAFYTPVHEWQEKVSEGVGFVGLFNLSAEGQKEAAAIPKEPDHVGYAFSKPGAPIPAEDLAAISSFAFDQYEGPIDVRRICESSDRSIMALHSDAYRFARLALERLEVPQYLTEVNRDNFSHNITRRLPETVFACAERADIGLLRRLLDQGLIDESNIDACIDVANASADITAASFLLQEKRERFSLPAFDFGV